MGTWRVDGMVYRWAVGREMDKCEQKCKINHVSANDSYVFT